MKNASYAVLAAETVSRVVQEFTADPDLFDGNDDRLLALCGIRDYAGPPPDPRIVAVLFYIKNLETIGPHVMDGIRDVACLSQSRLSHLFHQQTGMTLHSYLAFEKLQKTWRYVYEGTSVTEGCLLAGFDTPSHCAATVKRLFGLSMHDIFKTIASR